MPGSTKKTDLPQSVCELDACLAQQRKALFAGFKVFALNDMHPNRSEVCNIKVDINAFLALLKKFSANAKYNGVRIYFATCLDTVGSPSVPGGQEGHLSLIMAPTTQHSSSDPLGGDDDPHEYYHLFKACTKLTDLKTKTNWLQHYSFNRRPNLIDHVRAITRSQDSSETSCLWYPMAIIGGDGTDKGMIGVIADALADTSNPVTGFTVEFGCFVKAEEIPDTYPYYQLTLLFEIHQKNDESKMKKTTFLGSKRVKLLGLGDTDTGIPCPPSNTCPPPGGTLN
ncbi:MAG TPA: hypothetical protein VNW04_05805 [Puia sp.]|nr:hypothetical protein [Puia sp.]